MTKDTINKNKKGSHRKKLVIRINVDQLRKRDTLIGQWAKHLNMHSTEEECKLSINS